MSLRIQHAGKSGYIQAENPITSEVEAAEVIPHLFERGHNAIRFHNGTFDNRYVDIVEWRDGVKHIHFCSDPELSLSQLTRYEEWFKERAPSSGATYKKGFVQPPTKYTQQKEAPDTEEVRPVHEEDTTGGEHLVSEIE